MLKELERHRTSGIVDHLTKRKRSRGELHEVEVGNNSKKGKGREDAEPQKISI